MMLLTSMGLKAFYTDEFMNANTTAEERAALEALYAEKNAELDTYDVNYEITDFAELLYYCYGLGRDAKYVQAYLNMIDLADAKVMYSSDEDLFDMIGDTLPEVVTIPDALTVDNYQEKLIIYYFAIAFELGDPKDVTIDMVAEMFGYDDDDEFDPELAEYYKSSLYAFADSAILNKILPSYENDIVNGLAIKYSDQVNSMDELDKMVKAQLPADYLDSTKLFDDNMNKEHCINH